jgi:hypothetical protein
MDSVGDGGAASTPEAVSARTMSSSTSDREKTFNVN